MLNIILCVIYMIMDKTIPYGPHNVIATIFLFIYSDNRVITDMLVNPNTTLEWLDRVKSFVLLIVIFFTSRNNTHHYSNILNIDNGIILPIVSIIVCALLKRYCFKLRHNKIVEKEILYRYYLPLYLQGVFEDKLYACIAQAILMYVSFDMNVISGSYNVLLISLYYFFGTLPCVLLTLI